MIKKVFKKLTLVYYLIYFATIAVAILGFQLFKSGYAIEEKSQLGIAVSSALIILIIGSIPLSLAIFNKKTKQWALMEDIQAKLQKYEKGGIIRLAIVGSGLLLGTFSFFILNSQSMIFCAGIAAIGLFFCKPAEVKIISELKLEETE